MKKLFISILLIVFVTGFAQNYQQRITHLKQQPESIKKYIALGKIYDETGNYGKAIDCYQSALKLDSISKPVLLLLAKSYEQYALPRKALQLRQKVAIIDSTDLLNIYKLSLLYAKLHQKNRAIRLLEKLESIDTINPSYPYKTGIYEQDFNKKLDAFLRAYHKDSLHLKSIYMLVKYYKKIGFKDSVQYYLNKGLHINPNDTKLLRQKVIVLYRQNQFNKMLQTLQTLDSLQYDRLFVLKNSGLALLQLGQYQQAEQNLMKALNIDATDAVVYYYLGLVYENKQQYQRAKQYYQTALRLKNPDWDKEYYQLGEVAKKQKQYKKAINYFKKAFDNNKQNSDALLQLAMLSEVYYKSPETAIKYYQKYLFLFQHKDAGKTKFIRHQLKVLKEKAFMSR